MSEDSYDHGNDDLFWPTVLVAVVELVTVAIILCVVTGWRP